MRRINSLIGLFIILVVLALSPMVAADTTETTGGNIIISPWTYWDDPWKGRFYNPYGIVIGGRFWMYVQGGVYTAANGGPGSECTLGEEILAFSAPYTHVGLRHAFQYEGTVSPCNTSVPKVHYQLGSVFRSSWDDQYKMLIDETENGSAIPNFKRVLLMTSGDGRSWTPSPTPLIKQSVVNGQLISVLEVALTQGASSWWGFFSFGSTCDCSLGRMRVVRDVANPRGFVVQVLATDSTWKSVANDGSFDFMPAEVSGGGFMRRVTLVNNAGTWELWGNPFSATATAGCDDGSPANTTMVYRVVSETGPVGPLQNVFSSFRAMPTRNSYGREYPFRINDMNGKRIVYSASTDRLCEIGRLNGFRGFEIVLSVVDQ